MAKRICVINTKGGCGKTTIATNIASYYASHAFKTTLFDYDPQLSSIQWLKLRSDDTPSIFGVNASQILQPGKTKSWLLRHPADTQRIIVDPPSGLDSKRFQQYLEKADTIIIPVLPSAIDIYATAEFLKALFFTIKIKQSRVRIGIVANRIRNNTNAFKSLKAFLHSLKIPVVAELRDTQNYVRASENGLGIHELNSYTAKEDVAQWDSLMEWIER